MPPLRALFVGVATACVLLAILVAVFALRDFSHAPKLTGTPVQPPKLAADAVLVDQRGRAAHIVDTTYASTFLFFGYTHCPDECPLALGALGSAYRALTPAQQARTRIVFVTVDPARDKPAVLMRYAAHFDQHIVALTGAHDQLSRIWNSYGVQVQPQAKDLVGHGGTIYAIDATGHVVLIYPPDTKPSDLASDAAALAS